MKKLKYFLFILPFLFNFNVFAQNVTSSVRCSYNGDNSTYYGDPNDGFNSARCYDIGTRYSPRLGYIQFYLPTSAISLTAGKSYTVTMNMATNDWRNNIMLQNVRYVDTNGNVITSSSNLPTMTNFRFVSRKQIKFDFKLPTGTIYPYLRFVLSSPTYGNPDPDISSSSYMTGDNNWNLSSIDISPVSTSSGGTSGGTSGNTFDDSGIINNNNQNTTDIINNNNENTQSILDSQKVCKYIDISYVKTDGYLNSDGVIVSDSSNQWGITDYINIQGSTITVEKEMVSGAYSCFYNANKVKTGCNSQANMTTGTSPYIPENSVYVRFSIYKTLNIPTFNICTNGNQAINNSINQQNEYLMDDSDPNISDNEFTSLFNSVNINNPLNALLQLPVQFINAIVNQSNSCQVVNLGTLLGVPITLPCIDIGSILGSTVWNTIDILSSIGLIVLILKQLYESITNALTLGGYMDAKKSGLGYMSPLEFLCSALTGFGGDF